MSTSYNFCIHACLEDVLHACMVAVLSHLSFVNLCKIIINFVSQIPLSPWIRNTMTNSYMDIAFSISPYIDNDRWLGMKLYHNGHTNIVLLMFSLFTVTVAR